MLETVKLLKDKAKSNDPTTEKNTNLWVAMQ